MVLTIKIFKNEQPHSDGIIIEEYTQSFDSIQSIYEYAHNLIKDHDYEFEMWDDKGEEAFGMHSCENKFTGWIADNLSSTDPNSWSQYNVNHPDMWIEYEETHPGEVYES